VGVDVNVVATPGITLPVTTPALPSTTPAPESSSNSSVIAGVVGGVVGFLILIGVITGVVIYLKKKKKPVDVSKRSDTPNYPPNDPTNVKIDRV
jgi:hypothetical protein